VTILDGSVDDGQRWVLERMKSGQWQVWSSHVELKMLLHMIAERCGPVDESAIWHVRREWPRRYREHPRPVCDHPTLNGRSGTCPDCGSSAWYYEPRPFTPMERAVQRAVEVMSLWTSGGVG